MNKLFLISVIIGILLFLSSCQTDNNTMPDPPIELKVERLDVAMLEASDALYGKVEEGKKAENFVQAYDTHLAQHKDILLQLSGADMANMQRQRQRKQPLTAARLDTFIAFRMGDLLSDSSINLLLNDIKNKFPKNKNLSEELYYLINRYAYHFPKQPVPRIYTHANGYDPSGRAPSIDQVFAGPGFLSLGLHYFMGKNFKLYSPNIPVYIKRRFEPRFMAPLLAQQIAIEMTKPINPNKSISLMDEIIHEGIVLYVMDKLLPDTPDSMKIFYSQDEIEWAEQYEHAVYIEMLPKLYNTDFEVFKNYLEENAFSSDYSRESAPRLGHYIGWQVVRAYMDKHPKLSLMELCETEDYEAIFKGAGYKP